MIHFNFLPFPFILSFYQGVRGGDGPHGPKGNLVSFSPRIALTFISEWSVWPVASNCKRSLPDLWSVPCVLGICHHSVLYLSLRVLRVSQDPLVSREPQELRWRQLVYAHKCKSNQQQTSTSILFWYLQGMPGPQGHTGPPGEKVRNLKKDFLCVKFTRVVSLMSTSFSPTGSNRKTGFTRNARSWWPSCRSWENNWMCVYVTKCAFLRALSVLSGSSRKGGAFRHQREPGWLVTYTSCQETWTFKMHLSFCICCCVLDNLK